MKNIYIPSTAVIIIVILLLSGCGTSNPGAVANNNTGSGNGHISGSIYAMSTPASGLIQGSLAGASMIAGNTTAITDNAGTYSFSGLQPTTMLSAAKTGYIAQTIDGIPTTAGQDMHLSLLNPPVGATYNNTIPVTTATIQGIVANASGTPLSGANIELRDSNGSIWALGTTLTNGSYNAALGGINIANPATIIVSKKITSGTNYYTSNIAYATNIIISNTTITQNLTSISTNPADLMSVNLANLPLPTANVPAIGTSITIGLILPNGAGNFNVIGTIWQPAGPNNTTFISLPAPRVSGLSYRLEGTAADVNYMVNPTITEPNLGAFANIGASVPGTYTISLLSVPKLTGTATDVNGNLLISATPTLNWNSVTGAAQYMVDIKNSYIDPISGTEIFTFYWDAYTSNTTITKPNFVPANGGNMLRGQTYDVVLHAFNPVQVGVGNTYPINPFIQNTLNNRIIDNQNNMPVNSQFSVYRYIGIVQ